MKYNNFIDDAIDISIRDRNDDEVILLSDDVKFLYKTIKKWYKEIS